MKLRKFKIKYWDNGNIKVAEVEGCSKYNAKTIFYLTHHCDDIISIEEVKEE